MRVNRRFVLHFLAQASGAVFLASCGMNGFAPLDRITKGQPTSKDLGKTPQNLYGDCGAGDVYGYGYFYDGNGYGSYGQGPCDQAGDRSQPVAENPAQNPYEDPYSPYDPYNPYNAYDPYGYGYGYGAAYAPYLRQSILAEVTNSVSAKPNQSAFGLSFFERLTDLKRG